VYPGWYTRVVYPEMYTSLYTRWCIPGMYTSLYTQVVYTRHASHPTIPGCIPGYVSHPTIPGYIRVVYASQPPYKQGIQGGICLPNLLIPGYIQGVSLPASLIPGYIQGREPPNLPNTWESCWEESLPPSLIPGIMPGREPPILPYYPGIMLGRKPPFSLLTRESWWEESLPPSTRFTVGRCWKRTMMRIVLLFNRRYGPCCAECSLPSHHPFHCWTSLPYVTDSNILDIYERFRRPCALVTVLLRITRFTVRRWEMAIIPVPVPERLYAGNGLIPVIPWAESG